MINGQNLNTSPLTEWLFMRGPQ